MSRRPPAATARLFPLAAAWLLGACAAEPPPPPPAEPPPQPAFELEPVSFSKLEGWYRDGPRPALETFRRSCATLERRPDDQPFGRIEIAGEVGDWRAVCGAAMQETDLDPAAARAFFERWFQPYRITDNGDRVGLFTGYYEPLLHGSRTYGGRYTVPIHAPPPDLVRIDLGRFDPDLEGRWIAGRVARGRFVPYHSRAAIDNGALEGRGLELLWVDDPIDKFFLQTQGSGQVRLDDGSLIRIGYAAQNGHPYRAIGRDLVEIGAMTKDEVSLQSIRAWLEARPDMAEMIMARNRSYVFFEERPELDPDEGPLGTQGVPLTAGRSLAVDLRYIPLGAPVWVETTAPWPEGEGPLRRLMIAQDTGGAIKGVIRGDIFWGAGDRAEAIAGRMNSEGSYVLLLPRSLTPVG